MNLYQHSGKVGYGPAIFIVAILPLMIVLSCVYSYINVYNPIAGYLTILIILGYVAISGISVAALLRLAKCRSKIFFILGGFVAGAISLYFAWVFFLYALAHRFTELNVGVLDIILSPLLMIEMILSLNETGWYSIKGATPSGIFLWILWGVEAALVLFGIPFLTSFAIDEEMFCERCNKWCNVKETKHLKIPEMHAASKPRDINPLTLTNLEAAESLNARPVIKAELLKCDNCINYAGWRYKILTSEIDKDGNEKDKTQTIDGIVLA